MLEIGTFKHQGEVRKRFLDPDSKNVLFEITTNPFRQKIIATLGGTIFNFAPIHQVLGLYASEQRRLTPTPDITFDNIHADRLAAAALFGSTEHTIGDDDDHNIEIAGTSEMCDYYLYDFADAAAAQMSPSNAISFTQRNGSKNGRSTEIFIQKIREIETLFRDRGAEFFQELTQGKNLSHANLPFDDYSSFLKRIRSTLNS